MVFQRGFEPPTPALGGRCSIQLSYWNTKQAPPASWEESRHKREIPQRSEDLKIRRRHNFKQGRPPNGGQILSRHYGTHGMVAGRSPRILAGLLGGLAQLSGLAFAHLRYENTSVFTHDGGTMHEISAEPKGSRTKAPRR